MKNTHDLVIENTVRIIVLGRIEMRYSIRERESVCYSNSRAGLYGQFDDVLSGGRFLSTKWQARCQPTMKFRSSWRIVRSVLPSVTVTEFDHVCRVSVRQVPSAYKTSGFYSIITCPFWNKLSPPPALLLILFLTLHYLLHDVSHKLRKQMLLTRENIPQSEILLPINNLCRV